MKCSKKTYTSATKLTEDTWKCSTKQQKTQLLKSMNLDPSWSETKSIKEMVNRGGGLPAKSILNLNKIYLGKKGGKVTINWS